MYDGRRLVAEMWDGHANYKIEESEMVRARTAGGGCGRG
jgi:hypothetical protein